VFFNKKDSLQGKHDRYIRITILHLLPIANGDSVVVVDNSFKVILFLLGPLTDVTGQANYP